MPKRDEIIRAARAYEGVPYRHQGRSCDTGVDCAGLIICVAHELGITDYDSANYPRRPVPNDFVREVKGQMDQKAVRLMANGDVGLFAEPRHPCHSGILEKDANGDWWVIHAYAVARKVVRERLVGDRRARLLMVFSFRGLEDG